MNFSDKNNNSSNNASISKINSVNYDTSNTGYTNDKSELFIEKGYDESSTFDYIFINSAKYIPNSFIGIKYQLLNIS